MFVIFDSKYQLIDQVKAIYNKLIEDQKSIIKKVKSI